MWLILKTYYKFLGRYRGAMAVFAVTLVLGGVLEAVEPYFYKLFVDTIPKGNYVESVKVLVLFGVVRIVSLISDNVMRASGDKAVMPASRDVRMAVVEKIHNLDFAYHTSKSTGSLISLIKRGDGAFFDFAQSINISTTRVAISFVIMLIFLVRVRWEIGLIVVITFGLALATTGSLIRDNIRTRREFNQAEDEISDIIVDNLINFETVKLFAREKWEKQRLQKKFVNWLGRLWDYSVSFRMIDLIIGSLGNAGLVAALIYGLGLVIRNEISIGSFVMVVGFVSGFYNRFFELVYNLRQVAKHTVDIQKYFAILNETPEVADPKRPKVIKQVVGEIKFDNIWFAYPKNKNKAVEEINLDIRSGQSVAFVGHSGVGKTTLVKLLLRFYDPDAGKIMIDGVDIKDLRKSDLRAMVGVVPQEPIMFNNTIAYNITYGRSSAGKREMIAAAKMANLYDFIMTLPQKFETNVGERGVKLSGGQKQRLAIARMILKNPEIIIFDEATSQLDSESEKLIQDAFWKAAENKTTIVIAHRLSTVIRAEKIVVMEKGRIKEVGSHRQLLADRESLYSRFWALQTS